MLLELTLPALDEVGADVRWTLGGGTGLALKLDHRISYDIDIFLENASHLRALSPNRNKASHAISNRWQEPGHYLRLEREEGVVDFIIAARQTDLRPWIYNFKGRDVPIEEPAEILAKKLKYRGSQIIPRDIFDILAAHRVNPAIVKTAVEAAPDGARRAADRIGRIAKRYRETISEEVNPTATGAALLEVDPMEAAEILSG
jgi:hypothetical protein